jgi:hypothetical protein
MSTISGAERALLVAACRDRRRRFVERTRERPSEWRPFEVLQIAEFNIFFTDQTAFEFLADQILSPCVVTKVSLRQPPGESGYEMTFDRPRNDVLYAKLELNGQNVFGRSFHLSVKSGK